MGVPKPTISLYKAYWPLESTKGLRLDLATTCSLGLAVLYSWFLGLTASHSWYLTVLHSSELSRIGGSSLRLGGSTLAIFGRVLAHSNGILDPLGPKGNRGWRIELDGS
jgi:hypothetical protein